VDVVPKTHASDALFTMSIKKEHWLIWFASKMWYNTKHKNLSAERLLEILFLLNREFKRKFGRRLLDFEFSAWLDRLYSYEFYEALEEVADAGLVEYVVEVEIPDAPHDGDEDIRSAFVKHELDRLDVEHVRRIVKPLADAVEPPQDLLLLLEEVGTTLGDLVAIVEGLIKRGVRREVEKVLEATKVGQCIE